MLHNRGKRKSGELYTSKAVISPVLDDNGNIKFFVALESDISKEKALSIVDAYLNTEFEGGRHQKRVEKIPSK